MEAAVAESLRASSLSIPYSPTSRDARSSTEKSFPSTARQRKALQTLERLANPAVPQSVSPFGLMMRRCHLKHPALFGTIKFYHRLPGLHRSIVDKLS